MHVATLLAPVRLNVVGTAGDVVSANALAGTARRAVAAAAIIVFFFTRTLHEILTSVTCQLYECDSEGVEGSLSRIVRNRDLAQLGRWGLRQIAHPQDPARQQKQH